MTSFFFFLFWQTHSVEIKMHFVFFWISITQMSLRTSKTVRLDTKSFGAKQFEVMLQICNTRHKGLESQNGVSNQIFHYTRCITPKRVTCWQGPLPRHCARATQLLSKKYLSDGEPLAALCPIWPARDLNLRPFAPETNVLPLDQLAGQIGVDAFKYTVQTLQSTF